MPAPPPSARLLRAVAAERDELERHRARMTEDADELRRALARIERGLIELDERRALLERLAPSGAEAITATRGGPTAGRGTPAGRTKRRGANVRGAAVVLDDAVACGDAVVRGDAMVRGETVVRGDVATPGGGGRLLRGPEIREAAVRALAGRGGCDALHYRDWYALLEDGGYAIAGKDPLAVFLTQLGRSPAVRRGTGSGVYELDRHAGARHRAQLEGLQRELRELTLTAHGDLSAIRRRREQLSVEIGRVERSLEEIARVLRPAPPLAAAG